MDRFAKIVTAFVWISTLLVSAFVLFYTELPFLSALLLLSIAFPYLFSPRDFVLIDNHLVIKKVLGKVKIPIEDIEEVKLLKKISGIRVFGSGGLYGYFGYFHLGHIGSVKMYAKRRNKLVLISCKSRRIVISPENPEEFVAELESRIKNVMY